MKKKLLGVLLTAAVCTSLLAGCGSSQEAEALAAAEPAMSEDAEEGPAESEESETQEATEEPAASEGIDTSANYLEGKKIIVLLKSYTHMFWVEAANEAEMLADQYGCEVEILAPTVANSNEEQIELLENSLVSPPDLYIIVPADSQGIAPAIAEINAEGIPIVNVNTQITDESVSYDSYVSANQYELGYTTVSTAIEKLGEEGKAIVIFGKPGAQTYMERDEGASAAFAEHTGWEVLDNQVANGDRNEAMTVMQTLMTKYSDIDLVYAEDGEMALGAAEAIKAAGKDGEIKVVGDNSSVEICDAIKSGALYMVYDDAAWSQMETGFKVANLVLGGESVEDTYYSPIYLVDSDNVEEYSKRYEE
jgi:ABC-type sugar transport system substrate-binding protein